MQIPKKTSDLEVAMPSQMYRHIPEDLIPDILSRLPVKSLLRFKCVCKSWHSMICDPKFTLSNINGSRSKAVFMSTKYRDRPSGVQSINSEGLVEKCGLEGMKDDVKGRIGGSCNGLLLIIVDNSSFYLWNPMTAYFSYVLVLEEYMFHNVTNSALCYDSCTDDYKVIVELETDFRIRTFYVAGLREKRWKLLKSYDTFFWRTKWVLLNGFVHWLAVDADDLNAPQKIIAFDPKTDEASEVPLPDSWSKETSIALSLGVVDGCLWMTSMENAVAENIEVFAMKEYGVKGSWTRMFDSSCSKLQEISCSSYFYPMFTPMIRMRNGHEILIMTDTGKIFSYNPQTSECRTYEHDFHCSEYSGDTFVESLNCPIGYELDADQRQGLKTDDYVNQYQEYPWVDTDVEFETDDYVNR